MVFSLLRIFLGSKNKEIEEKNQEILRELEDIKLTVHKQQDLTDKDYSELFNAIKKLKNQLDNLKNNSSEELEEIRTRLYHLETHTNNHPQDGEDITNLKQTLAEFGRKTIENAKKIEELSEKMDILLSGQNSVHPPQTTSIDEPVDADEEHLYSEEQNFNLSYAEEQVLFGLYNSQADSKPRALAISDLAETLYNNTDHSKISYLSRTTTKLQQLGLAKKEREGKLVKVWISKKGIEFCRLNLIKKYELGKN